MIAQIRQAMAKPDLGWVKATFTMQPLQLWPSPNHYAMLTHKETGSTYAVCLDPWEPEHLPRV